MDKMPAISVTMPVYNTAKYLPMAIESVLNQTYSNFEFVIIDDGSTDGSSEIIAHYAKMDERIVSISRENRGIIYSRNEALALSKADYVALMDSDDICYPARLGLQVDFLNSHPDHVAVGAFACAIDSDGDALCTLPRPVDHNDIDNAHLRGEGGAIINPTAMIRKDAALKISGYNENYQCAEDFDFWLRLAEVGKLANIDTKLLDYRQHLESIGYKTRQKQLDSTRLALEDAARRRGLEKSGIVVPELDDTQPSNSDVHVKWGWWAFSAGNTVVARKHAYKALKLKPYNLKAWKLALCCFRQR
tara:strand:- start:297230 stop:298141 length:912 start_codon:yes stop_codon:yes gene_type:complete